MGKRILSIAMCLVLAGFVILSDVVTSNAQSEGAFNRVKFKGKRIVKEYQDNAYLKVRKKLKRFILPPKVDLRDRNLVTNVKDQGVHGTCWTHAVMSCLETSLISQNCVRKDDVDLSERHLAWYGHDSASELKDRTLAAGKDRFLMPRLEKVFPKMLPPRELYDLGGSRAITVPTLSRQYGIVDESNCKYDPTVNMKAAPESCKRSQMDAALKSVKYLPEPIKVNGKGHYLGTDYDAINALKQQLVNCNAISAGISSFSGVSDDEFHYVKPDKKGNALTQVEANHEITIVGYDDNISKDKFDTEVDSPSGYQKPKNNGAFIVKNSYGTGFGKQGYMYLSYDDASLSEPCVYETEANEYKKQDTQHDNSTIYQLDGIGIGAVYTWTSKKAKAGNVFVARDNFKLKELGLTTDVANVDGKVYVIECADKGNKRSANIVAYQNFKTKEAGFMRVKLDDQPVFAKGKKYMVVTEQKLNSNQWIQPVEMGLSKEKNSGMRMEVKPYESFIFRNGKWQDCKNVTAKYFGETHRFGNALIKAYGDNIGEDELKENKTVDTEGDTNMVPPQFMKDYHVVKCTKKTIKVTKKKFRIPKKLIVGGKIAKIKYSVKGNKAKVKGNKFIIARKKGRATLIVTVIGKGHHINYRFKVRLIITKRAIRRR